MRTTFELSPVQEQVFDSPARFTVVAAGRRGGKTFLKNVRILRGLQSPGRLIGYMAPTLAMSRELCWEPLLEYIPRGLIVKADQTKLRLVLRNGSRLQLFGEKYDRARGKGWDQFHFDEIQDIHPDAWTKVVRPGLSDRRGSASFDGTPKGKANLLYELFERGREGVRPEWRSFTWTTLEGGWVAPREIEEAKEDLDERTFRQEYEASFETTGAAAYYTFDRDSLGEFPFDPTRPTALCWDFNRTDIKPMVCLLVQAINGARFGSPEAMYAVVREFVYTNTSTEEMALAVEMYLRELGFSSELVVTGDYAGRRRESSASWSDYQIIEHILKNVGRWAKSNPVIQPTRSILDRVASLNSLFRSMTGRRRMYVDRSCKNLIEDLYRTEWKESGTKLNDENGKRTDESDALTYFSYNYHDISIRSPVTRSR